MKKTVQSSMFKVRRETTAKWLIKFLFLLTMNYELLTMNRLYCAVDPEIYFNSGIDKYVKGDYDGAIALFEQTLTENPSHAKAGKFLKKVLVEGAEKQIMESNSQKAKKYIERAKELFPDDVKVNELQKIINGLPAGPRRPLPAEEETDKPASPKIQRRAPVPETVKKPAAEKNVSRSAGKNTEKQKTAAEKTETPAIDDNTLPEQSNHTAEHFIIYFLVLCLVLVVSAFLFFIWIRKKSIAGIEKIKKDIRIEEETKFKRETEKIKNAHAAAELKMKKEMDERTKVLVTEKNAATEKAGQEALRQFESTIEEDKTLDEISNELKKEEYSKQIVQKMTSSIKTIMSVNRKEAINSILRLAKSPQPRLRYDCVKIIDGILNAETFEILLGLLGDDDAEVKKAAIVLVNNVCKLSPAAIPSNIILKAREMLNKEKLRNGWVI